MKVKVLLQVITAVIILVLAGFGVMSTSHVQSHLSFAYGFLTCGVVIAIILLLRYTLSVGSRNEVTAENKADGRRTALGSMALSLTTGILLLIIGLLGAMALKHFDVSRTERVARERQQVVASADRTEATRIAAMGSILGNLLTTINRELEMHEDGGLSDETIQRIVDLSAGFTPYSRFEGDSLIERKASPERGQLLIALCRLPIDSLTFSRILERTVFAAADLRNADLQQVELSGANLQSADLRGANLSNARMHSTDLTDATLRRAKLTNAEIREAVLKRADLSWIEGDSAIIVASNLRGVWCDAGSFRNADLSSSFLSQAQFRGALFHGARMVDTRFVDTRLSRSQFIDANLSNADLRSARIDETDLTGALLSEALVASTNWLDKLSDWNVTGEHAISTQYRLIDESKENTPMFRLELKDD